MEIDLLFPLMNATKEAAILLKDVKEN